MARTGLISIVLLTLVGCSTAPGLPGVAETVPAADVPEDLPIGELPSDGSKADGEWGAATTCKPIPDLPPLTAPKITISLNGLTLHLSDPATGYDKVFPVGIGTIDQREDSPTLGESRSLYPLLATGGHEFAVTPSGIEPCKVWWTNQADGQRYPYFAGLPFLRWWGAYGIHGPVDSFTAPNGGYLRRGFVSHGCIRMEAADVLEVYARIRGVSWVPVWVQREAERDASGRRLDVPQRWIGAPCRRDDDCSYADGFCAPNPYSGEGFCSAPCTRTCPDRSGYPTTFCVADPEATDRGRCVSQVTSVNYECRPGDHLVPEWQTRFGEPEVGATVCLPGSPGWIGDRCFADDDCLDGNACSWAYDDEPGTCTRPCTRFCPDRPGWPTTFCVDEPTLGAGASCVRRCTPETNASECPAGGLCLPRPRAGDPGVTAPVCLAP